MMRRSSKAILFTLALTLVILGVSGLIGYAGAAAESGAPVSAAVSTASAPGTGDSTQVSMGPAAASVARTTGIYHFLAPGGWKPLVMILVGFTLLYLGVGRDFEPLLLVPIGFGTILVNVPIAAMGSDHGLLGIIYKYGIVNELLPLMVFMGIGALCDFGPLLASPRTAILGAAAQFGVFGTLLGVAALDLVPGLDFTIKEACSIAVIGGADGPTSIYVSSLFAPHLMGPIAVAAYSYMALVPLIQPPIMRLLTTKKERLIRMEQVRPVSRTEKIVFPLLVLGFCVAFLPSAVPLMGCFAFGNFIKECGAVERLSKALQNEVMNVATILLGLGVGMQMEASKFLQLQTLGIILLGLLAFSLGTAGGVLFAKVMNLCSRKHPINPLIGSAGVSAFPMAARVSNRLGLEADPHNFLLMHALGANVAGQIGSVVAAGVILAIFGK